MMNIAFYNHRSKTLVRRRVLHDCHPGQNKAMLIAPIQAMYGRPGFHFPSQYLVLWHDDEVSVFSLDLKIPPTEVLDGIDKCLCSDNADN